MLEHTGNPPPNTTHWRKVRVGFQMSVSSCFTEMSWCQPGGTLTCRKCIRAMRLPRWNGVLWGLSAGFLRCNTRPWHCFVGLHPKSECIIWNFYASMATTDGTLSSSQLWLLLTCLNIFSQRKNKQRTCWSIRAILHPIPRIGGKWGLGFRCLFHPVSLKCPDVNQVEYSLAGSASEQWGSHDGMVFFEGSLLAPCDATPGLGTAL